MPELSLTEAQLERLDAVRADVEAAYVGRYGRATPADALDYLLDTYTPPAEADETLDSPATNGAASNGSGGAAPDASETDAASAGGGSPLAAVAALLEDNSEVWRESDGDARYEVDLPDGTTEQVRTKDDVKRLLFRHYR
jgi:hypothetical protein